MLYLVNLVPCTEVCIWIKNSTNKCSATSWNCLNLECCVCGYHIYKSEWTPLLGKVQLCKLKLLTFEITAQWKNTIVSHTCSFHMYTVLMLAIKSHINVQVLNLAGIKFNSAGANRQSAKLDSLPTFLAMW